MDKVKFKRTLTDKITSWLFKGKVIILYGPRQVGKTTLAKDLLNNYPGSLYLNCERPHVWEMIKSSNPEQIRSTIGEANLVVFDEAQKVPEIGQVLKLLIDTYPEIQYIATGSSSFELSNELSEPLTGRNIKFIMYPLSIGELSEKYDRIQLKEKIDELLVFGSYPDIVSRPMADKPALLDELAGDYLFRDVLKFDHIRRPDILVNLLKAIALQLGNEVSYRELSNLLKVSVETIQRYLRLLEQSFVLFSLNSFSRNMRNELARSKKYYFFDTGIRNSLIRNYVFPENRTDIGGLWENFCIIERLKYNQAHNRRVNMYFWRTYRQKEIDLIEETGGKLFAFEFKWGKSKPSAPKDFTKNYPNAAYQVVNRENIFGFLGI
jgi:predicted AAA+ superfamily ATPase